MSSKKRVSYFYDGMKDFITGNCENLIASCTESIDVTWFYIHLDIGEIFLVIYDRMFIFLKKMSNKKNVKFFFRTNSILMFFLFFNLMFIFG